MRANSYLLLAATAVIGVGLSGCGFEAKVAGGGTLPSTSGGAKDKANLGFHAAQCEVPGPIDAGIVYHDKNAPDFQPKGVAAKGGLMFDDFDELASLAECDGDFLEWLVSGEVGEAPPEPTVFTLSCLYCAFQQFDLLNHPCFQEENECTSEDFEQLLVDLGNAAEGQKAFFFEYESKNKNFPGEGVGFACNADLGEGNGPHGSVLVSFSDEDTQAEMELFFGGGNPFFDSAAFGPYFGYTNSGEISGNVQMQDCSCTDGIDNEPDGVTDEADVDCQFPDGSFNPNGDENSVDPI